MSSIAIMQPYIFPYIGYFQLISAVDKFIIYDDVNFIKQGWINRNNILVNGKPMLFTVPLDNASSFNLISATNLNLKLYPIWVKKFIQTIEQNYKRAPYFAPAFSIIQEVLSSPCESISELATQSILKTAGYLEIGTAFVETSRIYNNNHLKRQDRIFDICLKESANQYINPPGGVDLYSKQEFQARDINLEFIRSKPIQYQQFNNQHFTPWLSIIDVMMFNNPMEIRKMLSEYELF